MNKTTVPGEITTWCPYNHPRQIQATLVIDLGHRRVGGFENYPYKCSLPGCNKILWHGVPVKKVVPEGN
jgi:hypothetical protein